MSLSNGPYGRINGTRATADSHTDQETLSTLADQLLDSLNPAVSLSNQPLEDNGQSEESNDDLVYELAVRLYALYQLHQRETSEKQQDDVGAELERARLQGKLNDEVLARLDKIQDIILSTSLNHGSRPEDHIPTPAEHMGSAYGRKDYMEEILGRPWQVDDYGQSVTVMDLLLSPYATLASRALAGHPIIKLTVDRAWSKALKTPREGRIQLANGDENNHEAEHAGGSTSHSLLDRMYGLLTPRRQHFLHMISFLVLYTLTAVLSIHPRSLIVPYDQTRPRPRAIEVVFIIWAASFVLESLSRRSGGRIALAIPTFLCLNSLAKAPAAYSFLCLSIPALTVLLVLPSAPSLVYVSPRQTLPLATILYSALGRAISSLSLMGPVVMLVFALFAVAMNGETRLFTMDHIAGVYQRLWTGSDVIALEGRIAPYEARLSIFIALSILLVMAIPLAISQSYPPIHSPKSSGTDSPARLGDDDWDRDHPPYIALLTRQHWSSTVNYYLHPRPMMPLNILVLPLDLIAGLVMTRPVPLQTALAIRKAVLRWREVFVVLLMAPFCAALAVLEWFIESFEPRRRPR